MRGTLSRCLSNRLIRTNLMEGQVPSFRIMFLLFFAALGPVLLLWATFVWGTERGGFPSRDELTCTLGKIDGITQLRYGVAIKSAALVQPLHYARKSGDIALIEAELSDPTNQPVSLCYKTFSETGAMPNRNPEILEIKSPHGTLRSLEQVRASWEDDAKFMYPLMVGLLTGSLYLSFRAGIEHRAEAG
jgi:hypothetical protein